MAPPCVLRRRLRLVLLALIPCYRHAAFGSPEGRLIRLHVPTKAGRQNASASSSGARARVAVVMAGSARSFLFPFVHMSIKRNLIDALQADVDVFVRTTTQDNIHGKNIDARGHFLHYGSEQMQQLQTALDAVHPTKVQFFNLTDDKEHMASDFPDDTHAVFQRFDPRRYSMFYHRHMVYKMATEYAAANNFEYDWFVHARLDGAWGMPIDPISSFRDDGIWLVDRWLEHQPDTFAIVASKLAPKFFELRYKTEVMCLGGPDFDERQCKADWLMEQDPSLTQDKAKKVHSLCCTTWRKGNGHSEWFLEMIFRKNKLVAYYYPFFMVVVRDRAPGEMCGMLNSNMHLFSLLYPKEQVLAKQRVRDTVPSLSFMFGCQQMLNAPQCRAETKHVVFNTSLGVAEYDTIKGFECDDNPEQSWLPVHLRPIRDLKLCVTVAGSKDPNTGRPDRSIPGDEDNRHLILTECVGYWVNHHPARPWQRHLPEQMFFPRTHRRHKRLQTFFKDERETCLSSLEDSEEIVMAEHSCWRGMRDTFKHKHKTAKLSVDMEDVGTEGAKRFRVGHTCLTVSSASGGKMLECDPKNQEQLFKVVPLAPIPASKAPLLCKRKEACVRDFNAAMKKREGFDVPGALV